jgi:ATP-dependent helicase/nuclease subunit B
MSRVFTVPASAPFLPTVLKALVEGRLVPNFPASSDPLALAQATLYLPTRRACRLARDFFLDALGGRAAILPRIVALGDIDEDEIAFAEAAAGAVAADALDLPPALGGLERKLLLAQLVLIWAGSPKMRGAAGTPLIARNPAAALVLAHDLARLMDDMTTRQVSWDKLDDLVPDHVDEYWQLTLEFLKIAREEWPKVLDERRAIEPATRRDRLIAAEAARLARAEAPVIAAGSTGSMPSTAALLATIAQIPGGAVVLPGLDTDLDEAAWELIAGRERGRDPVAPAFGHPQFAMQALLNRLGIRRDAVIRLADPAAHGRELFVSEALRPAKTTELWQQKLTGADFGAYADAAIATLTMIEAANAEDEALAVAVVLREAAERLMNAALVTPDRALARRVLAALARWNVPVDDSGGDALADTPAGVFARLVAEAPLGGLAPVPLLALLKHQLFRLADARTISALERSLLRGPRPRPGTLGLGHALATFRRERENLHRSDPRRWVTDYELDLAADLVAKLGVALAPLESLAAAPVLLREIAARHRDVVAALSVTGREIAAFSGGDGDALAAALDELSQLPATDFSLSPADYPDLLHEALRDRVIRRPENPGVRVRIFGPLEARLQSIDRVVLGGLVEGAWPPQTRADAWLSRPMRHTLGLDLPERRIGLAAHDFAQALGAREVFLTRAAKLSGTPTLPSRFVQRLAAVAGEARWQQACARGQHYLELARRLDAPLRVARAAQPAPRPPQAARPTSLSVTEIEHWLRDPYTIYAKHILRLRPLDAVDTPPGAADRGTVIHAAIGEFTQKFAEELPADAVGELLMLGKKYFAPLEDFPEARAFWWPRFQRIARWFVGFEAQRRRQITALHAEIGGKLEIALGERSFRLTARADRIESLADGTYAILDYKTGAAPTEKQVRTGLAPQLTLEAAILRGGGFHNVAGAPVADLIYVVLKGREPAGEVRPIDFEEGDAASQADYALAQFKEVALRFEDEATPYRSLVHPMWRARYGDYDHLARVKEWSATGGVEDEAGAGE